MSNLEGKEDGWNIQLGGCCKFMCFPRPVPEDTTKYDRITDLLRDHKMALEELRSTNREQRTMVSPIWASVGHVSRLGTEMGITCVIFTGVNRPGGTNGIKKLKKLYIYSLFWLICMGGS